MLFKKKYNPIGCLPDTRPQDQKDLDVKFGEIVAKANIVNWREKPESEWRKFPALDQDGANACVAFTAKKLLGVYYQQKYNDWVDFSAAHIYQRRANKPLGGMAGYDIWRILKEGTTLEQFAPSKGNDYQLDSVKVEPIEEDVGKIFRIDSEIILPIKNIDEVASVIQTTGKAVMVWFYFNEKEWARDIPYIQDYSLTPETAWGRHSVAAVDFTLWNGKKALIIEDSAWFGGLNRRIILEDFYQHRNFYTAYFMKFNFEMAMLRPQYVFKKDLSFGMTDKDVMMLQEILKYEKLFPMNVESTGYFGSITFEAVKKWQAKYGIPSTGYVGQITRAKLNSLYG